jgi:hypothetical protein
MRLLIATVSAVDLTLASAGFRAADQLPQKFTNLQVFPKDITGQDLIAAMKQFCFDLNVRCEHCHAGEGNDLARFDFASDAKAPKNTARLMLRMVGAINGEHLKPLGPASAPRVTCFTCHRGATKPATRGSGD